MLVICHNVVNTSDGRTRCEYLVRRTVSWFDHSVRFGWDREIWCLTVHTVRFIEAILCECYTFTLVQGSILAESFPLGLWKRSDRGCRMTCSWWRENQISELSIQDQWDWIGQVLPFLKIAWNDLYLEVSPSPAVSWQIYIPWLNSLISIAVASNALSSSRVHSNCMTVTKTNASVYPSPSIHSFIHLSAANIWSKQEPHLSTE